ncbi:MAG TPA: transposase, partial [Thermoanaerobaculia bacterium]|nr:transposase [Thermoanaerobaculia bacterium]
FVDTVAAERLFRHKVIALLRDEGLLSEERIALLLSWRNSGFSVHNGVNLAAGDTAGIERLGRYLLRSPVAVERMQLDAPSAEVLYRPRHVSGPGAAERFAAADFLALALQHVPEPRLHQVRYYGRYSNAARARRAAAEKGVAAGGSVAPSSTSGPVTRPADPAADATETDETAQRRRQRRLWAQLLRRVYEVDPLTCRHCGSPMRVVAFIQEPAAIRKILAYLEGHSEHRYPSRDPPVSVATTTRADC